MGGDSGVTVKSCFVVQLGVHLGVHLVDGVYGGREVDQELTYFFQAVLLFDLPPFREGFEEVRLVWSCVQRRLEDRNRIATELCVDFTIKRFRI